MPKSKTPKSSPFFVKKTVILTETSTHDIMLVKGEGPKDAHRLAMGFVGLGSTNAERSFGTIIVFELWKRIKLNGKTVEIKVKDLIKEPWIDSKRECSPLGM